MSKKILISNNNGKVIESPVASVDEDNNTVNISNLTASNSIHVDGLAGFVNKYEGLLENISTIDVVSGSVLWSNAGKFELSEISLQTLGGDLEGLTSTARVVSVENVSSGILSLANGGTEKSSLASGSLFALSQSNIPSSAQSIVTVNGDGTQWVTTGSSILDITPLAEPIVYLYTGSAGVINTGGAGVTAAPFTTVWIKPAGCRFIRVICQAGGGGGAGAGAWNTSNAGGGGGGGGYADIVFNGVNLPTQITISAGGGGGGGGSLNNNGTQPGGNGGNSYFGNYVISYGGGGASIVNGVYTGCQGGDAGQGYLFGVGGGDGRGLSPSTVSTVGASIVVSSGGGAGGGGGGNSSTGSNRYGKAGGSITISSTGAIINGGTGPTTDRTSGGAGNTFKFFNFNKFYLNDVLKIGNFPSLLCSGGGGGSGVSSSTLVPGDGGSTEYGSGGGGGGSRAANSSFTVRNGYGGNGGKGYVLVICY